MTFIFNTRVNWTIIKCWVKNITQDLTWLRIVFWYFDFEVVRSRYLIRRLELEIKISKKKKNHKGQYTWTMTLPLNLVISELSPYYYNSYWVKCNTHIGSLAENESIGQNHCHWIPTRRIKTPNVPTKYMVPTYMLIPNTHIKSVDALFNISICRVEINKMKLSTKSNVQFMSAVGNGRVSWFWKKPRL